MWYRTGQANFTNASTTVTGVGTSWIDGVSVGEGILGPDNRVYEIASVSSNTSLTLGSGYLGTTASNSPYQIVPTQSYIRDLAAQAAELVANYGATMAAVGTGKFEDGTVTQPGVRFTADENTGMRRVSSDSLALVAGGVDRVTANTSGVSYTGTLTGGTGVVNLGSGQFVKDASGTVSVRRSGAGTSAEFSGIDGSSDTLLSVMHSTAGVTLDVSNPYSGVHNNLIFSNSSLGEMARFDYTGNFGIGTASPASKLHTYASSGNVSNRIESGSAGSVAVSTIYKTSARTWEIGQAPGIGDNSFTIYDATAGAVRGQFDTAGNFGLGVTPSAWNGDFKAIQVGLMGGLYGRVSTSPAMGLTMNAYRAESGNWVYKESGAAVSRLDLDSGGFYWYIAPSGTAGNPISFTQAMTLASNGNLGLGQVTTAYRMSVAKADGQLAIFTNSVDADLNIRCVSGVSLITPSTGTLAFGTSDTERARIDSSGNLLVGTTSAGGHGFTLYPAGSSGGPLVVWNRPSTASPTTALDFRNNGTTSGAITYTNTATTYATSSDARLKENISDADNGSALIDQLQVRKFDWKANGSHQRYGFVAQELDAVYPEAVSKPADPDEMMGVDYSKLVPLLVQEIQSLRARVASLEAA